MSSLFGPFNYKLSLRYGEKNVCGNATTKDELGSLSIELSHPSDGYRIDFSVTNEETERMENGERYKTGIVYHCGDPSGDIPNAQIGKRGTKISLTRFIKSSRLLGDCAKQDNFYLELQRGKTWEEITVSDLSSLITEKAERVKTPLITMPVELRYGVGGGIAVAAVAVLASVIFNPDERDYNVTRYLLQKYYDGLPKTEQRSLLNDMEYGGIDTLPATEMQEAEEIFERRFRRNAPAFIQEQRREKSDVGLNGQ